MKHSLQQRLFASYPNFYRCPKKKNDFGPLDSWGIECGDGWFSIIDNLSAQLEAEISKLGADQRRTWPRAVQIKEKFGTLRFYMDGHAQLPPTIFSAIDKAGELSSKTCERCGAPGDRRGDNWIYIACDKCEQERQESIGGGIDHYSSADMDRQLSELRLVLDARPK